jgi:predicted Zn finger-like uncharacterized protein
MIIVCENCSSRIQIEDAKVPASPFSVKCPKCNLTVSSMGQNPASQKSALSVGGSPSTDHPRFERTKAAPAFEPSGGDWPANSDDYPASDLAKALVDLLQQSQAGNEQARRDRPVWKRRQALVCSAESRRDGIASKLADKNYQVFVAENTRQAVERMRESQLDVVLLDPDFDPAEQGAAFVTREVNILRPAQRRRLFFGLLSPSFRTLDAHAAFLNNANLTVNFNDLEELPNVLDDAIREYNELYSDFYRALNLSPL